MEPNFSGVLVSWFDLEQWQLLAVFVNGEEYEGYAVAGDTRAKHQRRTNIKDAHALIVATTGFEQLELTVPRDELRKAAAKVDVASQEGKPIRGISRIGAKPFLRI